ncbi:MAG: hypothetical protein ABI920_07440 [Casimicrobiaceae bacterium]
MRVDAHRAKAESVERSLGRLRRATDYEMVIEGCMLAGTHWLNVLLHLHGLFPPERDAMHAEFMTLAERRKASIVIRPAIDALDVIEGLRTTHVRGDLPGGDQAAQRALTCLAVLRQRAVAMGPSAP